MRINRCVCLCQRNGESGGRRRVGGRDDGVRESRATVARLALFFTLAPPPRVTLSTSSPCQPSRSLSLCRGFPPSSLPPPSFLFTGACVHFYQLLRTPGACVPVVAVSPFCAGRMYRVLRGRWRSEGSCIPETVAWW